MADWQFELDVSDIWEKSSNETETTGKVPVWFVDELIKRLKELQGRIKESTDMRIRSMADELDPIIEDMTSLKTAEGIPQDDFNRLWDELYDWADTPMDNRFGGKTTCWVKTRI